MHNKVDQLCSLAELSLPYNSQSHTSFWWPQKALDGGQTIEYTILTSTCQFPVFISLSNEVCHENKIALNKRTQQSAGSLQCDGGTVAMTSVRVLRWTNFILPVGKYYGVPWDMFGFCVQNQLLMGWIGCC